jgi:hypothetical protein
MLYYVLSSKLTFRSTFDQHEERVRAQTNMRPAHLYRSFHEDNGTLSAFVTKNCHKKHKDVPHLRLADNNAFQNHGDFHPLKDMTPERMRRQLQTSKKIDPSPFVSAFNNLGELSYHLKNSFASSNAYQNLPRRKLRVNTRIAVWYLVALQWSKSTLGT